MKPFNLIRRSPFAFPGGQPGFDPTHPLAGGVCRISAVASGANVFNALNGLPGSPLLSPTAAIDGQMGQVAVYSAANARSTLPFTNINDTTLTVAAIFSQTTIAANGIIFSNATGVNGFELFVNASSRPQINARGAVGTTFTTAILAGVPYFVAVSATPGTGTAFLVLVNLLSGAIKTDASNFGTILAPTGSLFTVGNRGGGGLVLNGRIACAMQSTAYLGPAQLLAVAADPWSFWYPDLGLATISVGGAAVAPTTELPHHTRFFCDVGGMMGR